MAAEEVVANALYCPFTSEDKVVDEVINKYAIQMHLFQLRKSLGYTQEDIATLSGISISTISRIEQGGETNLKNVIKYAHACGYDLTLRKFESLL